MNEKKPSTLQSKTILSENTNAHAECTVQEEPILNEFDQYVDEETVEAEAEETTQEETQVTLGNNV